MCSPKNMLGPLPESENLGQSQTNEEHAVQTLL